MCHQEKCDRVGTVRPILISDVKMVWGGMCILEMIKHVKC